MLKSFLAGLLNIDDEDGGYETLVSLMRAAQEAPPLAERLAELLSLVPSERNQRLDFWIAQATASDAPMDFVAASRLLKENEVALKAKEMLQE